MLLCLTFWWRREVVYEPTCRTASITSSTEMAAKHRRQSDSRRSKCRIASGLEMMMVRSDNGRHRTGP
jgi:hypothetical protein